MFTRKRFLGALLGGASALLATTTAQAIPSLQLGADPDNPGDWTYVGGGDDTWYTTAPVGSTFTVLATANSDTQDANGDYAWENSGTTQTAYLVIATVPDMGMGDQFDVTVENNAVMVSLFDSGYGTPPVEDPNSIAGHGIFDTYFEIYEFQFDGTATTISNTEPPVGVDTGEGFEELFDITVNSLAAGVTGLHFDLFTVEGDGTYNPGDPSNRQLVEAFAPFSHDAQYTVGPGAGPGPGPGPGGGQTPPGGVPEPVTATMGVMAMAALTSTLRRRR